MRLSWQVSTRSIRILAVTFILFANGAAAQFPAKPLKLFVPSAAGSSSDITTRIISQKLGELWKQPLVVENVPGASGNIAAEKVAKSPADGYTLLFANFAVLYTNKELYKKLGYDIERDFEPITQTTRSANLLVVHPSLPVHSVQELISYGRANPGKLRYGSGGGGTSMHLCVEQFKASTGVDILHVPYKSSSQMATDLLGGQFELAFHSVSVVLPYVRAGKLRALAVTTESRLAVTPDLPTMAEAGVPDILFDNGTGLVAPKGTPAAIINKIYSDTTKVLAIPAVREQLSASAVEPVGSTPAAFATRIKSENARWAKIIRTSGMKLD